jgi:uncharacterized protein YaiI (UPF0178 family)
MGMLRDEDIQVGGPSSFNDRNKREFASSFERFIAGKVK